MRTKNKNNIYTARKLSAPALTLMAAAAFGGNYPLAQASVNIQSFSPAVNSTYTLTEDALLDVAPSDPSWNGSRLYFSAQYNWLQNPLVAVNPDRTQRVDTLVNNLNTVDLTLGLFASPSVAFGFDVPLNLINLPGQSGQFASGDMKVFTKVRLTDAHSMIAVSLIPEIFLPTGDPNLNLSDGGLGTALLIAFEHDFGGVLASANVGYRYSPNASFEDLAYTQRIPMALGLYIPTSRSFGFNLEGAGAITVPFNSSNNPGEFYAGFKAGFSQTASLNVGGSVGSLDSTGGNNARVIVGMKFSLTPETSSPGIPRERTIITRAAAPTRTEWEVAPAKPVPLLSQPTPLPAPRRVWIAKAPIKVVSPVRETPNARPSFSTSRVKFNKKEIILTEEIKFKNASAVLTDSGKALLDEVAHVLKENKGQYKLIVVEGHANVLGTYSFNQKLSEQRAVSVEEYLVSRGNNPKTFFAVGYGKMKPKTFEGLSTGAQLAADRRVKFKILN